MIWFAASLAFFLSALGLIGLVLLGDRGFARAVVLTDRDDSERVVLIPWAFGSLMVAIGLFVMSMVQVVEPGEVGVPVWFGSSRAELPAGLFLTWPLTDLHRFSTREETYILGEASDAEGGPGDEAVVVTTADLEAVVVEVAVTLKLEPGKVRPLYDRVGEKYVAKVVRPAIRSAIRFPAADYTASELATTKRTEYLQKAIASLKKDLTDGYGIDVVDIRIRNVVRGDDRKRSAEAPARAPAASARESGVDGGR